MYVRRKVFSLLQDSETGEEKYFSTTEFINEDEYLKEKIYSILDEYFEEREFSKKDETRENIIKGGVKLLDVNRALALGLMAGGAGVGSLVTKKKGKGAVIGGLAGAAAGTAGLIANARKFDKALDYYDKASPEEKKKIKEAASSKKLSK